MKSSSGIPVSRKWIIILLAVAALLIFLGLSVSRALNEDGDQFTKDFRLEECTFQSEGSNPYFNLEPGHQSVFEGKEGGTVSHECAWRAGEPDEDGLAEPGIIMPGTFLLGSRYYQELADGIALDRAEHAEMGLKITTPAGEFTDCVRIIGTTPLELGESEKIYCPDVGLVTDGAVEPVKSGK